MRTATWSKKYPQLAPSLCHNFVKCCPIFQIISLTQFPEIVDKVTVEVDFITPQTYIHLTVW